MKFGEHDGKGMRNSRYTKKRNKRVKGRAEAKKEFMKQTGYPHGRKGYVVDHIVPLKRGGSDTPQNMQWPTKEEAKIKDKTA